mgnify:CR=1 FL=1
MNAGLRLLNEDEDRTQKRQNFEFLMNMDTGNGLTQAEFVLAILEQQGVVDRERDVMPWVEVGMVGWCYQCRRLWKASGVELFEHYMCVPRCDIACIL